MKKIALRALAGISICAAIALAGASASADVAVATFDAAPVLDAAPALDAGPLPDASLALDAAPDAAVASVPDVDAADGHISIDDPGFLDRVVSAWRSGAGVPIAILMLFGVAMVLRRRFAWFDQYPRAAYMAAIIAGLAKLADVVATGAAINQNTVIGAFAGVYLLLVAPKPAPLPPEKLARRRQLSGLPPMGMPSASVLAPNVVLPPPAPSGATEDAVTAPIEKPE